MVKLLIFGLLSLFALTLNGQQVLQLEKKNSVKAFKFSSNDLIWVQLKGKSGLIHGKIQDFYFDQNSIKLEHQIINLKDIKSIRKIKTSSLSKLMNGLGGSMMTFGTTWALLSGANALIDNDRKFNSNDTLVSIGGVVGGLALIQSFSLRKYKIGKKWNLRMLNLDVVPIFYKLEPTH